MAMPDAGGVASRLALPWREELVGEGAAGRVTRAVDANGRCFAVKRFIDAAVGARELAMLRRLDRRFGPRLLGSSVAVAHQPLATWIALEWVEGVSLAERMADASSRCECDERVRLASIVAHGVAHALAELHQIGVRHGDVKPANILIHDHQPTRDAADDRGATLIDLSLAVSLDDALAGGTALYLAPEARVDASRVGPETDLYALGVVLRAIVGDAVCEPARWADALLAPSPGGRPSAQFIADRAARALGLAHDDADAALARKASVRRAYLRVRERDVQQLETGAVLDDALVGAPRGWLEEASAIEASIGGARARAPSNLPPVGLLDAMGRARWLTALFASPPSEAVVASMADDELAERLLAIAEQRPVFAYADLVLGSHATYAVPADLVSAAMLLTQPRPSHELLGWSEAALAGAPPSFAVALAEAFVRIGENGRAWMAIDRAGDAPEVLAVRAEIARRRGDVDLAARVAERAVANEPSVASWRARAVLARLAWDRAAYDEAEGHLEGARGPAAAEVVALVALARGQHDEGLRVVALALADGPPADARARLEGVRGMLEHAQGHGEASMRAFAAAAEHGASASVVEEATYLTGLGAAAIDVGHVGVGLEAATRAALLWERLGRREQATRAWLARASGLALIGADHEARAAADEVLERGAFRGDALAVAYAHLVHVETRSPGDPVARDHVIAAMAAVPMRAAEQQPSEERLRVDARTLVWAGGLLADPYVLVNDAACEAMSAATRFEWWGARVESLANDCGPGEPRRVLASLMKLLPGARNRAPVASLTRALVAGAALARKLGDGEAARRFEDARRLLGAVLREHTPAEYRARLEATPWLANLTPVDAGGSSLEPAQIAQLEALVRSLGARDRLAPLLNQVLDALLMWTGVERGLLLLRAPDGGLVARAGRNLARSDLEGDQRELSLGIARRALELGDVVVATDALASLGDLHASVHALRLRSVLAVPLIARGEALGVVYLDDRMRRGAFGPREIAWVRLLSTHAALAVADARDAVRLRRAVRHAERAKSRVLLELEARELELDQVKAALADDSAQVRYAGLAGRSEAMRRTLHLVARVSASDVPVLIVGESGTGKELLARAVHETGPRRSKAFVTENCGAVPEALLESILFGHKKGAFTGATATRPGLFEIADGGTLFLDEIGEMSASMQAKLLRVLQDGEIRAVGGDRTRHVDVRILAATHRDLEAMVKAGRFREDLFYRLNVVRIDVPALRDRAEDIPALVSYLVEKHAGDRAVKVTHAAMERLTAYPWPGNVRQLENEVRRAIVLGGDRIDAVELSPEILRGSQARRNSGTDLRSRLDGLEAELVQEALDKTRGNQTKAAELLGVSRFGLQKMIKRLGLRVPV